MYINLLLQHYWRTWDEFDIVCLLFAVNNFQSTDGEQCSKCLEYINLLCNFAILYFDISEDKVSRMHICTFNDDFPQYA